MIREVFHVAGEVFRYLPRFLLVLAAACVIIPVLVIHGRYRQWRCGDDRAQLAMDRGYPFLLVGLIIAAIVAVQVVIDLL